MHSKRIMITKPEQNEHKLFYSSDGEHKKALIGHLRVDFGSGDEFWHSWWGEHEEMNDDEFSDTLDHIFRTMRKHIFRDRESMRVYLKNLPTGQLDESQGFKETMTATAIAMKRSCLSRRCPGRMNQTILKWEECK